MPKASSHFYHGFIFWKNDIGMTRQILKVKPESKSISVKEGTDEHFRLSIRGSDTAHIPTSTIFGQGVHLSDFSECFL